MLFVIIIIIMLAVFNELQAPTSLNALIENSKKWSQSTDRYICQLLLLLLLLLVLLLLFRCNHPYLYEIQKFEPTDLQLKLQNPIVIIVIIIIVVVVVIIIVVVVIIIIIIRILMMKLH